MRMPRTTGVSRVGRGRLLVVLLTTLFTLSSVVLPAISAPPAGAQQFDEEVPPGNPVIGDDRPGDIESDNGTQYALWGLVAVCLIAAGSLLIKLERWEARRSEA